MAESWTKMCEMLDVDPRKLRELGYAADEQAATEEGAPPTPTSTQAPDVFRGVPTPSPSESDD